MLSSFICDAVAIKDDKKQRKSSYANNSANSATASNAMATPVQPPTPSTLAKSMADISKQHNIPPADVRLQ